MSQVAVLEYFDCERLNALLGDTAGALPVERCDPQRWSRWLRRGRRRRCRPARRLSQGARGRDRLDRLRPLELDDLRAAGVAGYCTPGYCSREVADFALACALAGLRGVVGLDRAMQAGVWEERAAGRRARARPVLGVIGLGKIGSLVAGDAAALGMRVLASDPVASDEAFAAARAERTELGSCSRSDVVTLHATHVRGPARCSAARSRALQARLDPDQRGARRADRHRRADPRPGTRPPRLGLHGCWDSDAAARRPSPGRAQSRAHAARGLVLARCRGGADERIAETAAAGAARRDRRGLVT